MSTRLESLLQQTGVAWVRVNVFPWVIGTILFVGYDIAVGLAVTGQSILGRSLWAWALIWFPVWMAQGLSGEPLHPNQRPRDLADPPALSTGLVGTCWALVGSGTMLHWTHWVAAQALGLPDAYEMSWFEMAITLIAAVGTLGLVPSAAIYARSYGDTQTTKLLAAESARTTARSQVLQSQMQPHFLFNALNTVTALLREDPARGRDVLLRLRALLERSLTTVQRPLITLEEEISFVRDQLSIEQERFRDRLVVTFDVATDLMTHVVPAFCIQPLVENALRHGIARALDGGRIAICASVDGTPAQLRLEVQDTGAGLSAGWREGTGLSNLRQRLAAQYGSAATLTIVAGRGHTSAVVTIPLEPPDTARSSGRT